MSLCRFDVESPEYYTLRENIPLLKSLEDSVPDKTVYHFPTMIVIDGKRQSGKTSELVDIYNKFKDEYRIAFVTRSYENCKILGIADCYTYDTLDKIRGKKYDLILFDDVEVYDVNNIRKIIVSMSCKAVVSSTMRIIKRGNSFYVEGLYFTRELWSDNLRTETEKTPGGTSCE